MYVFQVVRRNEVVFQVIRRNLIVFNGGSAQRNCISNGSAQCSCKLNCMGHDYWVLLQCNNVEKYVQKLCPMIVT